MSQFGPIFAVSTLDAVVDATVDKWLGTYLAEVSRQADETKPGGTPTLTLAATPDSARDLEEHVPTVAVVSSGMGARDPERRQGGSLGAWWALTLSVYVGGQSEAEVLRFAGLYGAAVRALIMHKLAREAGGLIDSVRWRSERRDAGESARTYARVDVEFEVLIPATLEVAVRGPDVPGEDAFPARPTVASHSLAVDAVTDVAAAAEETLNP